MPFGSGLTLADLSLGMLYLLAVSSLGVYGVIFAGWAANSKYAFLGSLRSTAQMVSYEVVMGLIILTVVLLVGSLNLTEIIQSQISIWYIIPLLPLSLMFLISAIAETNRAPFDLPEAKLYY
jgi:NADH-ubiquinone oxidoreductase chain 1